MNVKMPFWGALLLGLLGYARSRYPEHQALIDALIAALAGGWAGHMAGR
jgi:hypothetical protein